MAIAGVGTLGTGTASTSANSFSLTTATNTLASGDYGILTVVTDNISTADGNTNTHTSVSGGTGNWTKLGEYTNSPGGVAGDGVATSVWLFEATGTLSTGTTITMNLSANTTDKVCSFHKFTVGTGSTLVAGTGFTNPITNEVSAANGFGSVAFSSLTSREWLFFRGLGKEANSTTALTVSSGFTAITNQRSRNNASAVGVWGEFDVVTATGATSNPTLAVSGDTAGVFVALFENVSLDAGTGDYTSTGSASTFNVAVNAEAASYTSTGTDAQFTLTDLALSLEALAGAFTSTGQPSYGAVAFNATGGSDTIAGSDATLLFDTNDRRPVVPIVQVELDGVDQGWTTITGDVIGGLRIAYGINGASPSDRVASSGSCTFTLNNSATNSAQTVGYYSPANLLTRAGFGMGVRVRVQFTDVNSATTYTKFVGSITAITPVAGRYGPRTVSVVASDWFDAAARSTIYGLSTQLDVRSDEVVSLLVGNVPTQPVATDIDTGDVTFAYALDTARDDRRNPVLQELARVTLSEYGWLYQKGDGTVVFERQQSRLNRASSATLDNEMAGLSVTSMRDDLVTRVQVVTHPRTVDATTQVLYRLQTATKIEPGETITIVGGYTDPTSRASRVGGKDMITPVAVTDYVANTSDDGSGVDVTASLGVLADLGSNSVRFDLTNNGTSTLYVTTLQARGIGVYDYEQTIAEANDTDVSALIGEQVAVLDLPYQNDPSVGASLASSILRLYGADTAQSNVWLLGTAGSSELGTTTRLPASIFAVAGSVSVAPKDRALQTQILTRDIGDLITLAEDVTGIDGVFAIQSVSLDYAAPGNLWATWGLAPVDTTAYFQLDTTGFDDLGVTTTLA